MPPRYLLVEGASDVSFFERLLRAVPGCEEVEVKSPRAFGDAFRDTVNDVPKVLQEVLFPDMEDGRAGTVGVIVDADHGSGGGARERWRTLRRILTEREYEGDHPGYGVNVPRELPDRQALGSVFRHPDGLPSVGLWLMPDHNSNGMLEDLILASVVDVPDQQALLTKVERDIPRGDARLFREVQESKARVYTWLAWQKRPGLGLAFTLDPGALPGQESGPLLDAEKQPLKGLMRWLGETFA
ncbi:MAG: hypothetical protein H6741_20700 [Alphaproteobacteria bacterium]|nr:hypothetical protein [Alphaproteobacteria bacterium]MCB9795129.1 hypothetical protein [Alphaproteobacteria bacterium]